MRGLNFEGGEEAAGGSLAVLVVVASMLVPLRVCGAGVLEGPNKGRGYFWLWPFLLLPMLGAVGRGGGI